MIKKIFFLIVAFWLSSSAAFATQTILVLGDSLSAGFGLSQQQGWVSLLQQRLQSERMDWQVYNASISGETTSGGLTRIDVLLAKQRPRVVVLELGANDGLRGLDLATTRKNLETMILRAQKSGAKVLLLGMRLPPNYGKTYTDQFHQLYADLAKKRRTALVPFFMAGIVGKRENFQADGLHPGADAQPVLLETMWPSLRPLLKR